MRKKILVADDDPGIIEAMRFILEDASYEVITTDGHIKWNLKELPNLILLDICMSGVDGIKVCRYLKIQPNSKHIPVVMISARSDLISEAKKAGADDFIVKPFDIDSLLQKVAYYINHEENGEGKISSSTQLR